MRVSQTASALSASLVLLALPWHGAHAHDFSAPSEFGSADASFRVRPGLHFVERVGFTVGGDVISKLTHADGTIREISSGGLYQIGLGALYQADVLPLSVAMTLNYHYDSDYNGNNNASFWRVPLETVVYFNGLNPFRIGAGTRYVYSARASSTINGVTEKFAFQNTRGSIVEIGYQVRPYGWVNLRYVKETYLVENYSTTGGTTTGLAGNTPYVGTHVGVFISYEY